MFIVHALLNEMTARDRQDALVSWLRARGSATAEEAADRFGVSLRTVHRDVAALRERYVPIDGDPGRGGGLRLDPLRHLPPIELDDAEVVGLVLAVALTRAATNLPFGAAAAGAVDKAVRALAPFRVAELRRLLRRVWVGDPASPEVVASLRRGDPTVMPVFEAAFTGGCGLSFRYRDRAGRRSRRSVAPQGLLLQLPVWYLLAWDPARNALRMFRMDRIRRPELRGDVDAAQVPAETVEALLLPQVGCAVVQRFLDGDLP